MEEKEWVRHFIESGCNILGHRAHWIALLCERVEGRHVLLRREWRRDLGGDRDEEEAADESWGFQVERGCWGC